MNEFLGALATLVGISVVIIIPFVVFGVVIVALHYLEKL
jgi:hypothetical protein